LQGCIVSGHVHALDHVRAAVDKLLLLLLLLPPVCLQGRVVSGHVDALDRVSAAAAGLGALKVARLAVSGAFHTRLMAPAAAALTEVITGV
jgi:hypothetical protein